MPDGSIRAENDLRDAKKELLDMLRFCRKLWPPQWSEDKKPASSCVVPGIVGFRDTHDFKIVDVHRSRVISAFKAVECRMARGKIRQ
jgi:hypothetical protein